jgi:CBS domain-containing membrane protein
VLSGVVILLLVVLVFNNLTTQRRYPTDGRFSRSIKWVINPARQQLARLKKKD